MTTLATVRCEVEWFLSRIPSQVIQFTTGADLGLRVEGSLGPQGLTTIAADLLDLAAAVYQIERQLGGKQRTNPPEKFIVSIPLREPGKWSQQAIAVVEKVLQLLGNAQWKIEVTRGLVEYRDPVEATTERAIDTVALFSGGMDSTCGVATEKGREENTALVSFYTRQKKLQQDLAGELGFPVPVQWRMDWEQKAGRTHSFYYRSFLFLCLAAAVAESWSVRRILQFENGILALSIPPADSWMMTKHAHPRLHALLVELFGEIFGGAWSIGNPFQLQTKRGVFEQAAAVLTGQTARALIAKTETCWYLWSNRIPGAKKKPGVSCGVCIPCILRRTGLQDAAYQYDLRDKAIMLDENLGGAFRSYYSFLQEVSKTRGRPAEFYTLLPAAGRGVVQPAGPVSLTDLQSLFLRFADDFRGTFGVSY